MPEFSEHPSSDVSSVLVVGESGTGKTALGATLANAGYKVYVVDFDNKLAVLRKHLNKGAGENVRFITLKDTEARKATAFARFRSIVLNGWRETNEEGEVVEDHGKLSEWDANTVLFVDSLTFAGEAAKRAALTAASKSLTDKLTQSEWGDARANMENLLDRLTSPAVRCNVIMTALPTTIDDDSGISTMVPLCVTRPFSLIMPKYFDNVVRMTVKRDGTHQIKTGGDNRYTLRTVAKTPGIMEPDAAELLKALQA